MQNVITPLFRRGRSGRPELTPKHRREGFFDDQDRWHDADDEEVTSRAVD